MKESHMKRPYTTRSLIAIALVFALGACSKDSTAPTSEDPGTGTPGTPTPTPPPPDVPKTESQLFMDAARLAWTYVENNTQSSTGLAKAHETFQYVTTW